MSEKARILIGAALGGAAVVIATDSAWVVCDVEAISSYTNDLGIQDPDGPGIYLWEGTLTMSVSLTGDGNYEPDGTEYEGTLRPIRPEELAELLAMLPPPPPE